MIFNEMNNTVSYEAVQESPYDLGIGGALMHVYENECNYNAIMKAAALSEMKYYNETGGDLFVQEAGALSGLVDRVKKFFLKVIEKIKSICKKFVAKINQYVMKDKDFVKKYGKELMKKTDLTDFDFNGYPFPMTAGDGVTGTAYTSTVTDVKSDSTSDDLNDIIEKNRGLIVKGSPMTESEFREELNEKLYGDKETFDVKSLRGYLEIISNHDKDIKAAEKAEREITKSIDNAIKTMEKEAKSSTNDALNKNKTDAERDTAESNVKLLNNKIDVYRAYCNDMTVYYGAYVKALNDRNRQAKAICVKALSYKHEAATLESYSGGYGDIFAGVEIV